MSTTVKLKADRIVRDKDGRRTFAPGGYYLASPAVGGITFAARHLGESFTLPTAAVLDYGRDRAITTLDGIRWPRASYAEPAQAELALMPRAA